MQILKSRKGMSFAAVLGITMFVLASVTTVFVVGFRQAKLVDAVIENTEEYVNATQAVTATLAIIVRDQNLDPAYLSDLAAYMGVSITSVGTGAYAVSGAVDADASVTSYITYVEDIQTTYESFLAFTGTEPGFTLDPTITAANLLGSYVTDYVDVEYAQTAPAFTTFSSVVQYVDNLAFTTLAFVRRTPTQVQNLVNPTLTVDTYVTGNVTIPVNKDLTVTNANVFINGSLTMPINGDITVNGGVLFVDGNLTIRNNGRIDGIVVVNGSLTIKSNVNTTYEYIRGTVYVAGTVTTDRHTVFGDLVNGPTFIIAGGNVNLDSNGNNGATGIVYILCNNFYGDNATVDLTGGVYGITSIDVSALGIDPDPDLDASDDFFAMGIPDVLLTAEGTIGFRFTVPKSD